MSTDVMKAISQAHKQKVSERNETIRLKDIFILSVFLYFRLFRIRYWRSSRSLNFLTGSDVMTA